MVNKSIYSILVLFMLAIAIAFSACKKDEDERGNSDPNAFCNEGICLTNDVKKQQCIDAYNACIANEPDMNDDECVAAALLICQ